jgi:predicted amidohydrolase
MQLIACQLDITWERKPDNHAKAAALLDGVDIEPGALIVLPEMFATGFSMDAAAIDDADTRESHRFVSDLAARHKAYIIAGIVGGHPTGKGVNESVTFGPDGAELARYRKMQPFTLGGEADNYEAGDSPITFDWRGVTVSPFICYDLRFPEHFRAATRMGAELFTVIASWPAKRIEHWATLLRARAIENQAYVVGVNRCGTDPYHEYVGRSMIVDPSGQVLADAGDGERVITAKSDIDWLRDYREKLPFLKDMRPETATI